MLSLTSFLYVDVVAAMILAAWAAVRFPGVRPRSIVGALLLLLLVMAAAQVVPAFIPLLMQMTGGFYVVLIGCVLPVFSLMFLAAGWLLLAILDSHRGPRGGHRVPLHSRG